MTYAARETSLYSGRPFELYLFQTETETWRYTSGDVSRAYNGGVFAPEVITRTEIDQNQEARSGEIKITIPRLHDISLRFASYIPSTPMSLVIYRGHDGDPDSQIVMNFTGKVAKAEFGEDCVLTVVPESDLLRKRIPIQKYQSQCNRVLYDPGCGVDRTAFKVTGTLSYAVTDTIKSSSFAAKPDGWFNNGYIEHGADRRMILAHVGDTLTLIAGISGMVSGDSVNAYAGCSRISSVCASKFSNLANFWGFDRIPTRNPFDGGLE